MIGRLLSSAPGRQGLYIRPMRRLGRRTIARFSLSTEQYAFLPPIDRVLARYKMKRNAHEYVIWFDSRAVGYFQLNLDPRETSHYAAGDDVCGLEAMCVDSRYQGHGVAVSALDLLGDVVTEFHPHIQRINLTVAVKNHRARRAYARAGFKQTGTVLQIRNEPDQIVLTRFARKQSGDTRFDPGNFRAFVLGESESDLIKGRARFASDHRNTDVNSNRTDERENHEAA